MLVPSAHDFTSPEDYDDFNKVESNNYDLDYYVSKENLAVTFAEELEDKNKTQGGGSQSSKSDHLDTVAKGQVESKSKAISGNDTSNLEGCLEISPGLLSSGGFDNTLTITFTPLILHSPEVQTLDFLDKNETPQFRLPQTGLTSGVAILANQGQPLECKNE